jgi:hypothetical protein
MRDVREQKKVARWVEASAVFVLLSYSLQVQHKPG